jgi:glutathione synthase/RimK-type ligase-like ATP-grasp enzyme
MNRPDDILLMFDKRRTHALLAQHEIAVPEALPPVHSYDELMAALQERGWSRAFLKLAHGSSASGTVAYRYSRNRHQAFTTVELVEQAGELRLYNTRRIRKLESQHEIARLVDALCRHRLHVEYWIPKAAFANRIFDMRIVMIGGKPMHTVARMSHSPMTNLHLLNQRGDLAAILDRIGSERWQEALTTCERTAHLFASLYMGVDLLFSSDYRYHAVLELNAFGDLLPGLLYQGQDTYSAEILAALEGQKVCSTLAR